MPIPRVPYEEGDIDLDLGPLDPRAFVSQRNEPIAPRELAILSLQLMDLLDQKRKDPQ